MKHTLRFYSPLIVLCSVAFISSFLVFIDDKPACNKIFGLNLAFIGLVQYFYLYPVIVVVSNIYFVIIGSRAIAGGVFPPKNIPLLSAIPPLHGLPKWLLISTLILSPIFGVWLFWAGNYSFFTSLQGMSINEFQYRMEIGCWLA